MRKKLLIGLGLCSIFLVTGCDPKTDEPKSDAPNKNVLVCTGANETWIKEGKSNYLKFTIEYNDTSTKVTNFTYQRIREFDDETYNAFTEDDKEWKLNSFKTWCEYEENCEVKWQDKSLIVTFDISPNDEIIENYIKNIDTSKEDMKIYFETERKDNRNWKCE